MFDQCLAVIESPSIKNIIKPKENTKMKAVQDATVICYWTTRQNHKIHKKGGGAMETVLRLGKVTYGDVPVEILVERALKPYFEDLTVKKTIQENVKPEKHSHDVARENTTEQNEN